MRGTGCGKSARPGLRGSWASNRPFLPGSQESESGSKK